MTDKIINEYIRESLKLAPVTEQLELNRLSWYGHVRRKKRHVTCCVMNMNKRMEKKMLIRTEGQYKTS
jgi:hypothetical protein